MRITGQMIRGQMNATGMHRLVIYLKPGPEQSESERIPIFACDQFSSVHWEQ